MEDKEIIALYFKRDQQAIVETNGKYGPYCRTIAVNLLGSREDAEECVNDTWHTAWRRMPPELPQCLKSFLGRITRNLSISRYRANTAQKRYDGLEVLLSELDECVPDSRGVEQVADAHTLSQLISDWLDSLEDGECALFVGRYWKGCQVKELARRYGCSPNTATQRLARLRRGLKDFLEQEGIAL